jgi:hypothetical protein
MQEVGVEFNLVCSSAAAAAERPPPVRPQRQGNLADATRDNERQGCLDAEQLAEYLDGRGEPAARIRVERHAAACPTCGEVLLEAARLIMKADDPRLARLERACLRRLQP